MCSRGGYRVGNGINWKGQVFPRMRNFTASHKMTGVGNALKRHYQLFLLEYEQVGGWEGIGTATQLLYAAVAAMMQRSRQSLPAALPT